MIAEMLTCLALNVYHESKNQSIIGQYAVAQVTLNRVKDERFPNNICDVVKQGLTYKWNPTHYHAHYVQPSWAETKTYIIRIDDHIFYRWDINYD
jgi:spore germination cell wall hydrolase CwlJ-like protein